MHNAKIFYSEIERATLNHFSIDKSFLLSRRKDRAHCRPRDVLIALARRHTSLSLPQIGDQLHRDHTSILAAQRRAAVLVGADENFRNDLAAVESKLLDAEFMATPLRWPIVRPPAPVRQARRIAPPSPAPMLSPEMKMRRDWLASVKAAAPSLSRISGV